LLFSVLPPADALRVAIFNDPVPNHFRYFGPRGVAGCSGADGAKLRVVMNVTFAGLFSVKMSA
jgi:hypothetical protein